MSRLDKQQIDFLKKHDTSPGAVFDASGLTKKEYRDAMKELGKIIASGVSPCAKAGHTLRTRSGHCIQCNPASIAFQKRHSMHGYVYIAGSLTLSIIKVGMGSDVENRMKSLNRLQYGGACDWTCVFWVNTQNAGKVEFDTHAALNRYAAPTIYKRNGADVHCLETFSCSAAFAIDALYKNLSANLPIWESRKLISLYNFPLREGDEFLRGLAVKKKTVSPLPMSCPAVTQHSSAEEKQLSVETLDKHSQLSHNADLQDKCNVTISPSAVLSQIKQDDEQTETQHGNGNFFIIGMILLVVMIYLANT